MTKVGFEPTSNGGIAGPKAVAVTTLLLGQSIEVNGVFHGFVDF